MKGTVPHDDSNTSTLLDTIKSIKYNKIKIPIANDIKKYNKHLYLYLMFIFYLNHNLHYFSIYCIKPFF